MRKTRVLLAKPGLDGHDRGIKVDRDGAPGCGRRGRVPGAAAKRRRDLAGGGGRGRRRRRRLGALRRAPAAGPRAAAGARGRRTGHPRRDRAGRSRPATSRRCATSASRPCTRSGRALPMSSTACCPPPVRRWPDDAREPTTRPTRASRSGGLHGRGRRRAAWTSGWDRPARHRSPAGPTHDVPRTAVDDAAVRGVRVAGGDERAVPVPARAGSDRVVRRVRPADAARATTRAIRQAAPRSAGWASRSTPPTTWWICSPGCRSTASR